MTTLVQCAECGAGIAPGLLSCPSCARLVYSEKLTELARLAQAEEAAGRFTGALTAWREALEYLPPGTRQHETVQAKVAELSARMDAAPRLPWWQRAASLGPVGVLAGLLGKAKFLLLGLSKLGTLLSFAASLAVYWALWGWRFAFLIGAAVVPFGVYLRSTLPETLTDANRDAIEHEPQRLPPRLLGLALLLMMAATIGGYGLSYMTTFAQDSLRLAAGVAFGATIMNGLGNLLGDLLSGLCSDRYGRKPVMLVSIVLLILLVLPGYLAMTHFPGALTVYLATSVLCVLQQLFTNAAMVTIAESLPTAVRSTVLATLYAIATTVFGGTTQLVIKLLTEGTGSSLAPAWYISGALAIGAVAVILIRETAPVKTGSSTFPHSTYPFR